MIGTQRLLQYRQRLHVCALCELEVALPATSASADSGAAAAHVLAVDVAKVGEEHADRGVVLALEVTRQLECSAIVLRRM